MEMMQPTKNYPDFYPPLRAPYYIVAPPYRRYSAGVRVLHLLCNALNLAGQKAYIVLSENTIPGVHPLHPRLITPVLTKDTNAFYLSQGLDPIAIYPELVIGNPLNFKHVVRYLLHFAGAYGGPKRFPESDMILSYTEDIRRDYGRGDVLMIPVADPGIFHPPAEGSPRKGICFYAHKYRLMGGTLLPVTQGGSEITKDYPVSVRDLADMLRKSEIFYAYENTSLMLEAALCGCPAVQLFGNGDQHSYGNDGVAFSLQETEIGRAKATVHNVWNNYRQVILQANEQIKSFIDRTQNWGNA